MTLPLSPTTFDPGLVVGSFAGHVITGYADGSFINVERNEDTFTLTVGADGTPVRRRSRNKSGKIKFTLLQSSISNDFLSGQAAADEAFGTGYGPFLLKDLSGRTLMEAAVAWVVKPASVEFGKDVTNREWTLETGELLPTLIGGN